MKKSKSWFKVPAYITPKNKIFLGVFLYIFCVFIYMGTNKYPLYDTDYVLSPSWFDNQFPLLPWTLLIYWSEYILFIWVYLILKSSTEVSRYVYGFIALQIASCAIFWFFPTAVNRTLHPIPEGALGGELLAWFRTVDEPRNALPSLHISACYFSALAFLGEHKKNLWISFIWATIIALTTFTTKQHYIIDIAAGFAVAVVFHWIFYRKIEYYPLKKNVLAKSASRRSGNIPLQTS